VEPTLLPQLGPIPALACLVASASHVFAARRYSKAPRVLDGAPGNAATVLGVIPSGVWVMRPDNGSPDVLVKLVGGRGRHLASGTRGMLYRQGAVAALVTDNHTYWAA